MIAVIKGDISDSRRIEDAGLWLDPLKKVLATFGETPRYWEIVWGDWFQLEIKNIEEAYHSAVLITAVLKQVALNSEKDKRVGDIGIRMSIGIGEKTYDADRISEKNGSAFWNSGEQFEKLGKVQNAITIKTPWANFDEDMNLYFQLNSTIIERWTINSAELMEFVLKNPTATQEEISFKLRKAQSSISRAWDTAKINEILSVDKMFRKKIKEQIHLSKLKKL